MSIEPVNERPIFPALIRADGQGLGTWSVGMVRQLTTVFQQYGYKLNKTMLAPGLVTNANELNETGAYILDEDATGAPMASTEHIAVLHIDTTSAGTNGLAAVQMAFRSDDASPQTWRRSRADDATDMDDWGAWEESLSDASLAANGGTIPETDRSNTFTEDQHTDGAGFIAENDTGNWFDAIVTDDSDSQIFRGRDSGDNIIGQIITRDLDGAGAGHLELAGLWAFVNMPSVGADALIETGSNANGSWISFAGLFAVAWRVVTPDWTQGSFQDWDMPITFGMEPMMFVTMHTHTGGGPGNAAIDVLQGCTTSASGGNDTFRIAFRDGLDATAAGEQITITAMGTL